jgi:novobiocin biosynthesis protein NovU/D-mycarose 3-C-methyltransferase
MARRNDCRICGSRRLQQVLDLGRSPLANRFLTAAQIDEAEPSFPLDVFLCAECSLLQLVEVVDPEILFRHYLYLTGTSETTRGHFAAFANALVTRFPFQPQDLIVEVASNDGTFLSGFQGLGFRVLGVEPAVNIAELAARRGIRSITEFFDEGVGARVAREEGPAACVVAANVFAHVDDINGFVRGVLNVLAPEGIFVFEAPYVRDMLDRLEFDAIYHEHLSYFSIAALSTLFERHGMEIFDIAYVPVQGGSLRVFVKRRGAGHTVTDAPGRYRDEERRCGLQQLGPYDAFARRVHELRSSLLGLLGRLRGEGKRIAAYAASAKGTTLLNFTGIGGDVVEYIVDKNPLKQGMFSPGKHLPVLPVEHLRNDRPDYLLLLAWNFADEVLQQQQDYVRAGGRFILPVPSPRVIPA